MTNLVWYLVSILTLVVGFALGVRIGARYHWEVEYLTTVYNSLFEAFHPRA